MPQFTQPLRFAATWLATLAAMATSVALIEVVIRGHVEWVHVVGSSVSIATAVALAGGFKPKA